MSTENKDEGQQAERSIADVEKEIKSEFNRKLDNVLQDLAKQSQTTQQMMEAALATINSRQAAQAAPNKKLADLAYENPEAFDAEIDRRVEEKASRIVNQTVNASTATNSVLSEMTREYPELNDVNSDIYKEAIEVSKTLSSNLKGTPDGVRYAIREAAARVGAIPSGKRTKQSTSSEEFSLPGNSGQSRERSSKKDEIPEEMLAAARIFKLDLTNPKVKAEFEKAAKRKNYEKYQG